jgi:hypothetical protein
MKFKLQCKRKDQQQACLHLCLCHEVILSLISYTVFEKHSIYPLLLFFTLQNDALRVL